MAKTVVDNFDLIVIGAGPGGYVCAVRAAQLGLKTACIEATPTLGGTCLNVGCIPSKALLESSHHYYQAKYELAQHGIDCGEVRLDLGKMLARKDKVVEQITSGVAYLFSKNKVSWLKGSARLEKPGQVAVKGQEGEEKIYAAKHIVIATGSTPIELASAPFDHQHIIDSTDALALAAVPKHLIVIGGGVIGLELGSVWLRLGAKVSVIEAMDSILASCDRAVAKEMHKLLQKQGMSFYLNTQLESVEVQDGEVKILASRKGEEALSLSGDKVLVAVGRRPNIAKLNLEGLGIRCEDRQRSIQVDEHYRTTAEGVYAIGDVIRGPMLAHKAEEEGIALAENLAGKAGHVNYEAIASIVYTWPEVAFVGKSEEQCRADKIPYRLGKFYFKANGRAKAMEQADGFVKILAHAETDRLLGIHIVGPMASEMIAEAALAFEYGASAEDLARSVHAHPTLAEVMKEAALDVDKRAIHS